MLVSSVFLNKKQKIYMFVFGSAEGKILTKIASLVTYPLVSQGTAESALVLHY